MERVLVRVALVAVTSFVLGGCASTPREEAGPSHQTGDTGMRLGNFSVSLAVKDIRASAAFYEKLGFRPIGGKIEQNWLILQNESATIGLFQGMFEKNTLTFNPGWDKSSNTLADFDDVREIQAMLRAKGVPLAAEADETTTGPAFLALTDPDGNPVLIDQHAPSPKK